MTQPSNDEPLATPPEASATAEPLLITSDMLAPAAPVERRINFEQGLSYLPPMTIGLIVTCVIVFIWELISGALWSTQAIIDAGALAREEVLDGEIWRTVTAMFLHGSAAHLIGNCVVLYIVGMALEHALGLRGAILLYFASGIAGSALSVVMNPGPSVGASGAIFGVWGGVIVFLYRHQRLFYLRDKRVGFVLLIWALYTILIGFLDPTVDNYAHIGGFAAGAAMATILPKRRRPELEAAFSVLKR